MGDQGSGQLGSLMQGLFYSTPFGSRYAQSMSALEAVKYRKLLEELRKQQLEQQRAEQEDLAEVGGMEPSTYSDPAGAMAKAGGMKVRTTKGYEARSSFLKSAAAQRSNVALANALRQLPGSPEIQADMGEVGTWPGALQAKPGPTREVEAGLAKPPEFTIPPSEETGREAQTYTSPPWISPGQFPRRSPITTGPTSPDIGVVKPPMTSMITTKEAVEPRNPNLFEAIGQLPEAERPYAATGLLQHSGAFKPPTAEVDNSANLNQAIAELEAHFKSLPPNVQSDVRGMYNRAVREKRAAIKNPRHLDNAAVAEKDYYTSIERHGAVGQRAAQFRESLNVRRQFLANAQAMLEEAKRRNDIDSADRAVDNIKGEIQAIRSDLQFWMTTEPNNPIIQELRQQLARATQLLQYRDKAFTGQTREPRGGQAAPPPGTQAPTPKGRVIRTPSGKEVEVLE